mgnify:CR=1 FL=1
MYFRRIISKEGWELRLHEEHEIFSISIFKDLNYDEAIQISYCDLYMLAFNNTEYSLFSKDEIISHLELLDKICYVKKQKELLDYAIAEYSNDIDEWKSFINPSIIEIEPQYLLTFPDFIDFNLGAFSKLTKCDNLKRQKLLQFAQDGNTEAFSILFDKSLINGKFMGELFKCEMKFIKIIIDKGFNDWNSGMYHTAEAGDKELVDFFIEKGADDWNGGMNTAAKGGHKNLVLFFIEKGSTEWNTGMNYATIGGNKDLVDFFIEKGANHWDLGLYYAALGGHKDLVLFFIEKGAHNWNEGMTCAAEGGHKELVLFFIEKGANDWESGLYYAALGGHKDLVLFFIKKGANHWDWGMEGAAQKGHKDLVLFFIEKGANDWESALEVAEYYGHTDLVEFFNKKINNL